jgi:hypothetical protein
VLQAPLLVARGKLFAAWRVSAVNIVEFQESILQRLHMCASIYSGSESRSPSCSLCSHYSRSMISYIAMKNQEGVMHALGRQQC